MTSLARDTRENVEAMSIRVLLADDHTISRTALRARLSRESDIKVVADVDRGSKALRLARALAPDVVVMDIGMPGMNDIGATRQLVTVTPGIKVLALSSHMERHYISQMLEAGAMGYVVKSTDGEELLQVIRSVAQNRTYFSAEAASIMVQLMRHNATDRAINREYLSRREREVLALLAEGKTSQEIAAKLHITAGTVIAYRRNISDKLGLHGVAELTQYAIREGMTSS